MADPCDNHTYGPEGYLAWHAWAERMSKTQRQRKCPGCGLYMIWEPKADADASRAKRRDRGKAGEREG